MDEHWCHLTCFLVYQTHVKLFEQPAVMQQILWRLFVLILHYSDFWGVPSPVVCYMFVVHVNGLQRLTPRFHRVRLRRVTAAPRFWSG